MTSRTLPLTLGLALLLLLLLAPRPALAGGYVAIDVSPNVLVADGISTATVTATVVGSNGRPARDGTEVRFYTTAGNITQVAVTSAGVARATLTSSSVPQTANITVAAGFEQNVVAIPMVSKVVEASVGGRVMKVTAKYVAFSEDKKFIQADGDVLVKFRGVQIEANSLQLDINRDNVKALGKVSISSGDKTLVGERLWLDLKSFEAYIVAVRVKKWFSAYGLTDLPERPKNFNADFNLVDLTDSKIMWIGKEANYIIDDRVQMKGARAFVGGAKTLRMPYHEAYLKYGFGQGPDQYVGVNSEGITLNVPVYLAMSPSNSVAVHLNYGTQATGIGYISTSNGLSVDLVDKYGFAGASEGQAMLTNIADYTRWGFAWNHTQQIDKTTRFAAIIQLPEHREAYGSFNLTKDMPRIGTIQANAQAVQYNLAHGSLHKTLSFAFESKPRQLANKKLAVSVETGFYRRDPQQVVAIPGLGGGLVGGPASAALRIPLKGLQAETIGFKMRPATVKLGSGFTLENSATLQAVTANLKQYAGFGPAIESQIRKQLPRNGFVSVGLSYNQLPSYTNIIPLQGRTSANLNLTYPITRKLRVMALGNMALDAPSYNSILQVSYEFKPKWRFDILHTLYRFGGLNGFDYQLGITRTLGGRDVSIFWSHQEHRFFFEFGATRF